MKLHKASDKGTLLLFNDFESTPLLELRQRIKINLRNFFVQVFEYSEGSHAQLLFFMERYLAADHPSSTDMKKHSAKLRRAGVTESGCWPDRMVLEGLLLKRGNTRLLEQLRLQSVNWHSRA